MENLRRFIGACIIFSFASCQRIAPIVQTPQKWIGMRGEKSVTLLTKGGLFVRLEHAYHHLNWAWNCRRTPEERVWHFADRDADRLDKFPDTADFADLWPLDRTAKVNKDDLGLIGSRKKISLFPLRPDIQLAQHKLNSLCRFVEKECFGEEEVVPPKGMRADVWQKPLTEKDFARRLHRIYTELNIAWNSRRDKDIVTEKRAIDRRRCFSPDFATGCYNMWR